jgi:hypothetical protein
MSHTDGCPCGRSQHLTFAESNDKIVIDRKTFKQLLALLNSCVDELVNPRDCEIFLTFLDTYLSENNSPEPRKALLLLNYYRDIVPDALEEIADRLEEAREIFKFILTASRLGGGNE